MPGGSVQEGSDLPRLRTAASKATGSAPVELRDTDHPIWQDADLTRQWLAAHDLKEPRDIDAGPNNRFSQCSQAWAVSAGLTVTYGQSTHPFPDWGKMRAAGIANSRGTGIERLNYHATLKTDSFD